MAGDALAAPLSMYVKEREDIPAPSAAVADQVLVAVPTIGAAKLARMVHDSVGARNFS